MPGSSLNVAHKFSHLMLTLAHSVPFSMTGDSSLSSAPVDSLPIRLSMSKRANSVE